MVWPSLLTLLVSIMLTAAHAEGAGQDTIAIAVATERSFDRDLAPLEFAHTDLQRFVGVLVDTGRVPEGQIKRLVDPDAAALRDAFRAAAGQAGAQKATRLVFYFTGHADAGGLHLRDGRFDKHALHELMGDVPVETRIAFLDSCYSGALAAKGIKPAEAFQLPKAELDEPSGSVFLAASSGSEVAFEIEELEGSLFTHFLVLGLYGQADTSADGLVTIEELYQFVYREVALRGAMLPAGGQRPEYRVDLKGRGALVLSFPRQTTATVTFAEDLDGEVTVAPQRGLQLVKFEKAGGRPYRLSLVPGSYQVLIRGRDRVGRGEILVRLGAPLQLASADFRFEAAQDLSAVAKGHADGAIFGASAGLHTGLAPYGAPGPVVELALGSPAAPIKRLDVRAVALLSGRRSGAARGDVEWPAAEASVMAALDGALATSLLPEGARVHALLGAGQSRFLGDAVVGEGVARRRFEREASKIAAGLGASWLLGSGLRLGADVRREWAFLAESGNDPEAAVALATNVFALSLRY